MAVVLAGMEYLVPLGHFLATDCLVLVLHIVGEVVEELALLIGQRNAIYGDHCRLNWMLLRLEIVV